MSFNPGGGGGSSSIAGSTDVALSSVQNDQVLAYDNTSSKWQNKAGGGGYIRTWNGTSWTARPTTPAGVPAIAYSTHDAAAPAPPNAQVGDIWERHPQAV